MNIINTAHTPGPWQVANHFWDDSDDNGMSDDPIYVESEDGLTIIGEASGGLPFSEQSANARLMTAAPDLLAALHRLNTAGEDALVRAIELRDDGSAVWHNLRDALYLARAAIARAEGGANV